MKVILQKKEAGLKWADLERPASWLGFTAVVAPAWACIGA